MYILEIYTGYIDHSKYSTSKPDIPLLLPLHFIQTLILLKG